MTTPLFPAADRELHIRRVPAHVSWSFGGVEFAPISQTAEFTFRYLFDPADIPVVDPKTAVQNALTATYTAAQKPLAICLSGSDSEIIAVETHSLGIPFELYFLDIWGNNAIERSIAEEVARSLGKTLTVITLEKNYAWTTLIPSSFKRLQAAKPTYLVLPYLMRQIPSTFFIVGGEGDVEKNAIGYSFDSATEVPISTTEVFYRQVAIENRIDCNMYFFSSTPELIMSFLRHPLLTRGPDIMDNRDIKAAVWPLLKFTAKTNNWSNVPGSNAEICMYTKHLSEPDAALIPQTFNVRLS